MGYTISGYIIREECDWSKLKTIGQEFKWYLYFDEKNNLYHLTVGKSRKMFDHFSSYLNDYHLSDELKQSLSKYNDLSIWLGKNKFGVQGIHGTLNFAHKLSDILYTKVFGYVSDDDELDMACICDKGEVVKIHNNRRIVDVIYENGSISIVPLDFEEQLDFEEAEYDPISKIREIFPYVHIENKINIELLLHRIVIQEFDLCFKDYKRPEWIGSFDYIYNIIVKKGFLGIGKKEYLKAGNSMLKLVMKSH